MIQLPPDAPEWARQLADGVEREIDLALNAPLPVFTLADRPAADDLKWVWKPYVLSDGAGNKWVVISNGTTVRYLEGTGV